MDARTALFALVLVLAACAGGGSDATSADAVDIEVRPLEEVLDSPIVVSADPSGTSATVTLTTTVPLACAAIYGEDDRFGMVATDADMAGAAIIDHAPVLLGLQPETDYRYVMQGSDAAGFGVRSRSMGDGTSIIERYQVVVDDDQVLGPFDADPEGFATVETDVTGQRFRFEAADTTGGNTGFVAVEIYAEDQQS